MTGFVTNFFQHLRIEKIRIRRFNRSGDMSAEQFGDGFGVGPQAGGFPRVHVLWRRCAWRIVEPAGELSLGVGNGVIVHGVSEVGGRRSAVSGQQVGSQRTGDRGQGVCVDWEGLLPVWGVVDIGEQDLEFFAGVEESGHDGAEGTFGDLGDFLIAAAVDFAQEDDGAVFG